MRRLASPTGLQSAFLPNIAVAVYHFFSSSRAVSLAPSIQRDRFLQIIKPRYFIGRYRRRGDKRSPRAIFAVAAAVGRSFLLALSSASSHPSLPAAPINLSLFVIDFCASARRTNNSPTFSPTALFRARPCEYSHSSFRIRPCIRGDRIFPSRTGDVWSPRDPWQGHFSEGCQGSPAHYVTV